MENTNYTKKAGSIVSELVNKVIQEDKVTLDYLASNMNSTRQQVIRLKKGNDARLSTLLRIADATNRRLVIKYDEVK